MSGFETFSKPTIPNVSEVEYLWYIVWLTHWSLGFSRCLHTQNVYRVAETSPLFGSVLSGLELEPG